MKKARKVLLAVLCAALLVGASVAGTLAYMQSSATVTNTFTTGNVDITMDETKVDLYGAKVAEADPVTRNEYKLIPGHEYIKDPTIHVTSTSEDCWLVVKIQNDLGEDVAFTPGANWEKQQGELAGTSYWLYKASVSGGANIQVFDKFTYTSGTPTVADVTDKAITVTAYAIQADGIAKDSVWTTVQDAFGITP